MLVDRWRRGIAGAGVWVQGCFPKYRDSTHRNSPKKDSIGWNRLFMYVKKLR